MYLVLFDMDKNRPNHLSKIGIFFENHEKFEFLACSSMLIAKVFSVDNDV